MTDSASTLRFRGHSPARWLLPRIWLAGAGIIALTIAGSSLLLHFGFFMASIFFAVLCGLGLVFLCGWMGSGEEAGPYFLSGLCGLVIGFAGFVVGQDEVVLFGSSARGVLAANAADTGAAFLHFRDARVLADRRADIEVMGQSSLKQKSHLLYYLHVAPIVDAGWIEGQPVASLAVIGSPQLGHRMSEWRAPLNGGVRVNAEHLDEQAKAVRNLSRFEKLNITPKPVFLRWSADPEGDAAAARLRIRNAYLIALALWTACVLINGVMRRSVAR